MRSSERSGIFSLVFIFALIGMLVSALAMANDFGGVLALLGFVICAFLTIFTLE